MRIGGNASPVAELSEATEAETLQLLRHNVGFDQPEAWIPYALKNDFRRVKATRVLSCPDCGSNPRRVLGQYVHYSTLMRLRECSECHLIWADAQLDPQIVAAHFESAYKDPEYYVKARGGIHRHLAAVVDSVAPRGASVLDIGGALGDLMHLLKQRRDDVSAVVHDISPRAVKFASEHFQLPTVCGDIGTFEDHDQRYDVVVLSDVLYYVPELATFWRTLPRILKPGGSVVLRVPGRLALIRFGQALRTWFSDSREPDQSDSVRHHNPEHIYILSRRYLSRRLASIGFDSVSVQPSPALEKPGPSSVLSRAAFMVSEQVSLFSKRKLGLFSGVLFVARDFGSRL